MFLFGPCKSILKKRLGRLNKGNYDDKKYSNFSFKQFIFRIMICSNHAENKGRKTQD